MKRFTVPYLIMSSMVIIAIGLSYGLVPTVSMPLLYGIAVDNSSLIYVLRAVMGLYLTNALYWLYCTRRGAYVQALRSQMVFLPGLIIGRIISLFIEGIPGFMLVFYLVGEIFFLVMNRWIASSQE